MRWSIRVVLLMLAVSFAVTRSPFASPRSAKSAVVSGDLRTPDDMVIPVAGIERTRLKSNFDDARAGHVHHALDIMAPRGTPVLAAVDGTIRKLFTSGAGGITIYQFDGDEKLVYYYAHLDRYASDIREGMPVKRGMLLGYVGSTGNAPYRAPHLHFAIERLTAAKKWWGEGAAIDPYPILMEHGVTLTTPASAPPERVSSSD